MFGMYCKLLNLHIIFLVYSFNIRSLSPCCVPGHCAGAGEKSHNIQLLFILISGLGKFNI